MMRYVRKGTAEVLMVMLSLIALFPVLYMIVSSFKTPAEIGDPISMPSSLYLGNYVNVFQNLNVAGMLVNSMYVTLFASTMIVLLGSMAAYPLGRRSRGLYGVAYIYFLSGLMIPFSAGIVPLFRLIRQLGLMNRLEALVFISTGSMMPITVMIIAGFVKSIPREIEEAAIVDGSGYFLTFTGIILPLLRPAIVTVVIVNILPVWNDFFNPLLFISQESKRTLPIAIYSFMKEQGAADYGSIFTVSVIAILFPVLMFLCFQNQFYKGIASGAVKG